MALWTVAVYNNFDVFNKTSFSYPGNMSIQMIDHLKFSRLRSLDHGTDLICTKWLHLNTRLHEILDLQDMGSGIPTWHLTGVSAVHRLICSFQTPHVVVLLLCYWRLVFLSYRLCCWAIQMWSRSLHSRLSHLWRKWRLWGPCWRGHFTLQLVTPYITIYLNHVYPYT